MSLSDYVPGRTLTFSSGNADIILTVTVDGIAVAFAHPDDLGEGMKKVTEYNDHSSPCYSQ